MGQNYGAGKKKRVRSSYLISLTYSFGIGLLLGVSLVVFGRPFLSLFTRDAAVMDAGMYRLTIMGFSYCISAFMDCTIAGSQSPGQKYCTDVHCHHGLLCIPCDLGLYGICVFSYDSVPVPAVYVFLEHYCSGGDPVFHTDLQTKNGSPVVRQRSHFSVSTRSRPARWCMVYAFRPLR